MQARASRPLGQSWACGGVSLAGETPAYRVFAVNILSLVRDQRQHIHGNNTRGERTARPRTSGART